MTRPVRDGQPTDGSPPSGSRNTGSTITRWGFLDLLTATESGDHRTNRVGTLAMAPRTERLPPGDRAGMSHSRSGITRSARRAVVGDRRRCAICAIMVAMHLDLSGKTALVTGSTQGIGEAIAAAL